MQWWLLFSRLSVHFKNTIIISMYRQIWKCCDSPSSFCASSILPLLKYFFNEALLSCLLLFLLSCIVAYIQTLLIFNVCAMLLPSVLPFVFLVYLVSSLLRKTSFLSRVFSSFFPLCCHTSLSISPSFWLPFLTFIFDSFLYSLHILFPSFYIPSIFHYVFP